MNPKTKQDSARVSTLKACLLPTAHCLLPTALLAVLAACVFAPVAGGQTRRGRATPRRTAGGKATKVRPKVVAPAPPSAAAAATTTSPSGLTSVITRRGEGRQPKAGETVVVHYTGVLTNGVKFDSSHDRNAPIAFKLGAGRVIKGWDEGIANLRVGDRAALIIPPQLGYGSKGAGGVIPPDATLIFIVELMDVKETSLSEVLSQTLSEKGIEAALAQYRAMKAEGLEKVYSGEGELNSLGYRLLRKQQVREAIEVFKLNVEAYPNSANVYDSLAEAYMANGDKELALENHKKSLQLKSSGQ